MKRILAILIVLFTILSNFEIGAYAEEINIENIEDYAQGEILVKYVDGRGIEDIQSKVRRNSSIKNLTVSDEIKIGNETIDLLEVGTNNMELTLKELNENPNIEYAEPNYLMHSYVDKDPYFNLQWGLKNTGQVIDDIAGVGGCDIDVDSLWEVSQGSPEVIVAVIDSGVDISHNDLSSNIFVNTNETLNGIDDDGNGYIDDINGWNFAYNIKDVYNGEYEDLHATHIAGIVAGASNGIGVQGVAPNVTILPLKFMQGTTGKTADAIRAIEYAEKMGAKIVNCSWGSTYESLFLYNVIANSNMLFVCASGNNNISSVTENSYPSGYDLPNVISVASMNNTGEYSSFTNFGSSVDLAAPGEEIYSTAPDNSYEYLSGTSMAAPFVAGVAVLTLSSSPYLSGAELKNKVLLATKDMKISRKYTKTNGYLSATPEYLSGFEGSTIVLPELNIPRYGAAAISNNLNAFIMGGYNEDGYTGTVEKFDFKNKEWNIAKDNVARGAFTSVVQFGSNGDYLMAFGGYNDYNGGSILDVVGSYDIQKDKWTYKYGFNLPEAKFAMASASLGENHYLIGGVGESGYTKTVYKWSTLMANRFTQMPDLPYELAYAAAVSDNLNNIYVIGGANKNGCSDKILKYNETNNNWTEIGQLNIARRNAKAFFKDNKIIVYGGNADYTEDGRDTILTGESDFTTQIPVKATEVFDINTGRSVRTGYINTDNVGYSMFKYNKGMEIAGGWNGSYSKSVVLAEEIKNTPVNISITSDGDYHVLKWAPVQGAEGYQVEVDGDIVYTGAENEFRNLANEKQFYTYRIRAKKDGQYWWWSDYYDKANHDTIRDAIEVSLESIKTEENYLFDTGSLLWYKITGSNFGKLKLELESPHGKDYRIALCDDLGRVILDDIYKDGKRVIEGYELMDFSIYVKVYSKNGGSKSEPFRLTFSCEKRNEEEVPARVYSNVLEQTLLQDTITPSSVQEENKIGLIAEDRVALTYSTFEEINADSVFSQNITYVDVQSVKNKYTCARVTNKLLDANQKDFYSVSLNAGDKLTAVLKCPPGYSYGVYTFKSTVGDIIAGGWYEGSDEKGEGITEYVAPTTGTYYVGVWAANRPFDSLKNYTLDFYCRSGYNDMGYESNYRFDVANRTKSMFLNSIGTNSKSSNGINNLFIDNPNDSDYYAIDLQAGDKITACIEMNKEYSEIQNQYVFELHRVTSVTVDEYGWTEYRYKTYGLDNPTSATWTNKKSKTISFVADVTGAYYVTVKSKLHAYSLLPNDKYKLTFTKVNSNNFDDIYETPIFNNLTNDFTYAKLLPGYEQRIAPNFDYRSKEVKGNIDNQLDIDWFCIDSSVICGNLSKVAKTLKLNANNNSQRMILWSKGEGFSGAITDSITHDFMKGREYFIGVYSINWQANDDNKYKIEMKDSLVEDNTVLDFKAQSGGKYIYSSNPENIEGGHLAESGNMLDNYENLLPGKYTYMAWYHNGTSSPIYTDVLFTGLNNSRIKINKVGLQVFIDGDVYTSWTGLQAYSDFKRISISNEIKNRPTIFPAACNLPIYSDSSDNSKWLSDIYKDAYGKNYPYMQNYNTPIYIVMEFEVLSGMPGLSTIAYKTTSANNKNKFSLSNAPYIQDIDLPNPKNFSPTFKGMADYAPVTETNISHQIVNDSVSEYCIPVLVNNTFGATMTDTWITNLNPQNDTSVYFTTAETDMLGYNYADYRTWQFDTKRTSLARKPVGYPDAGFVPNDLLPELTSPPWKTVETGYYSGLTKQQISVSMGNYGVETRYTVTIANTTGSNWNFNYQTTSCSGTVVGISDNGDQMQYANAGSYTPNNVFDRYVGRTILVPANTTKSITVSVILTTADAGGVTNSFHLNKVW